MALISRTNKFIAQLEPVRLIGVGSFDVNVYKYQHSRNGFICAGKNQALSNRGLKELEILKMVRNKHIIRYIADTVETINNEPRLIIFMELADMTLSQYVQRCGGKIENAVIWRSIAYQLIDGVSELHWLGIVHRDLSYNNIMVKRNQFKIADFDVSTTIGNRFKTDVGTLSIKAPELLLFREYDEKVDIWALGCIFFYIANGSLPFQPEIGRRGMLQNIALEIGFREDDILSEIGYGNFSIKPSPFSFLKLTIGEANWDLLISCMKTSPNDRPSIFKLAEHPTFDNYYDEKSIPTIQLIKFNKEYLSAEDRQTLRERFKRSVY